MLKKILHPSILARYIISYVVIMFVIFLGVGIYVNINFERMIQESVFETNTNRLGNLRSQHEEQLSVLTEICNQISLSPRTTDFKFL